MAVGLAVERLDAVAVLSGHVQQTVIPGSGRATERQLNAAVSGILAKRGERYPEARAALADLAARSEQDRGLEFGRPATTTVRGPHASMPQSPRAISAYMR